MVLSFVCFDFEGELPWEGAGLLAHVKGANDNVLKQTSHSSVIPQLLSGALQTLLAPQNPFGLLTLFVPLCLIPGV